MSSTRYLTSVIRPELERLGNLASHNARWDFKLWPTTRWSGQSMVVGVSTDLRSRSVIRWDVDARELHVSFSGPIHEIDADMPPNRFSDLVCELLLTIGDKPKESTIVGTYYVYKF